MGTSWVTIGVVVALVGILLTILLGGLQAFLSLGQWLFGPKRKKEERGLVLQEHAACAPDGEFRLAEVPLPEKPHGRKGEVPYVHDLLRHNRAVTLLGVPGTGKSAVAALVARSACGEFADVWGFSLAADPTKAGFLARLGEKLGGGDAPGASDLEGRALAALAEKRRLLVLDDFEAVLGARERGDPGAAALLDLLDRTGKKTHLLLVAGDAPAGLLDEDAFWVPRLEREAAVRLLHDALAERRREFHEEACHEIIEALDRHPLACRLVGGHLAHDPSIAPRDAAARLREGVAAARARTGHPGLAVALDLSLAALSPDERRVLEAAAAFPGPFAAPAGWSRDALDRLCERGLIERRTVPPAADGERHALHAAVRKAVAGTEG